MLEVHYKARQTCLPSDNPYLTDAWQPTDTEWTATSPDLQVIGEVPKDLNGIYLRNGHNQIHAPIGRYHPFDGDGMVHALRFNAGAVEYRNRWIRTTGFMAEQAAGKSLWPGIIEPGRAVRRGYWASTRRDSRAAFPGYCKAPIATCSKMKTGRLRSPIRFRLGSTTPPLDPSTPGCTIATAPNTYPAPTPMPSPRRSGSRAPRASSRRSSPRTPSPKRFAGRRLSQAKYM